MSQQQPASLSHWRIRQTEVGAPTALKEASLEIDRLLDEVGRKRDAMVMALCMSCLWGFVLGFLTAWWRWA